MIRHPFIKLTGRIAQYNHRIPNIGLMLGGRKMEFIFIRHGHGEHLNDYPNRLNTLHPSLTEYGKFQVTQQGFTRKDFLGEAGVYRMKLYTLKNGVIVGESS